jgi:hypothetical protein
MTGGSSFTEQRERGSVHHRGLSALAICLTVFGFFAVLTGSADVVLGPHLLVANGAALGSSVNDPWLDSQLRFLGAMWAGWGALSIWTCRDLRARGQVFEILSAVFFVAGCGRVASCFVHPGSPALLEFFAALELAVAIIGVSLRRLFIAAERRPDGV